MGIKKSFSEFFLNKSSSYRFYKEQYNSKNDVEKLRKDFEKYKAKTNKILKSHNYLFNNLYLDYELKPKEPLSDVQRLTMELLSFVDNVSKKYGLKWWLDFGNLIGAVRHQNFIPWDDDMDIGMMRSDYIKFNQILADEIKDNNLDEIIDIYYKKRLIDDSTIDSFIQILIYYPSDEEKKIRMASVDIFPYDYIRGYDENTIDELFEETKKKYYRNIAAGRDFDETINQYYDDLNLSFEECDLIMHGVEGACGAINIYDILIVKKDIIFPLGEIEFAGKMLPCPRDYETYLGEIYGNYMKIPNRVHAHGKLKRLRKIGNTHNVFNEFMNALKKANKNF